jgi:hypothetical protein
MTDDDVLNAKRQMYSKWSRGDLIAYDSEAWPDRAMEEPAAPWTGEVDGKHFGDELRAATWWTGWKRIMIERLKPSLKSLALVRGDIALKNIGAEMKQNREADGTRSKERQSIFLLRDCLPIRKIKKKEQKKTQVSKARSLRDKSRQRGIDGGEGKGKPWRWRN